MTQRDGTVSRVHICGTVRWIFTSEGRVVIQFATDEDLHMALNLLEAGLELVAHHPDDNQLEYKVPSP